MEKCTMNGLKRRAAVLAVTAALGGSALLGAAAPMTAWAAGTTCTVTIHPAAGNEKTSYQAYRLFTAVINDKDSAASKVDWDASVDAGKKDALIAKINELTKNGYDQWVANKGDKKLAQNVLEYISEQITASDKVDIKGQGSLTAGTFGMKLATWIANESGIQPVAEVKPDAAFTNEEGYYLFVTKDASGAVATSPIWFPLGGRANEVFEKASVPTVDKTMGGAEAGSGQIGEELPFVVTATLPGNYNSYSSYAMTIKDTPTNLAIVEGSVVVKSGDKTITNAEGVSVSVTGTGMTVMINDLKKADPAATNATKVVVEYKAKLTPAASNKPGANANKVEYEYSSNPGVTTETITTTDPEGAVPVYTFLLNLSKKDKHTDVNLDGAEFIIRNEAGKYYDKDAKTWSLDEAVAKAKPLTTSNGTLTVMGMDEGTFTLTEVKAPEKYELPGNPSVTIKVTPDYNFDGTLKSLAVEAKGDIVSAKDEVVADMAEGTLSVTAVNDKNVALAMTGAEGVGMAGAGVVALGLVWYAVRSRRDRANQQ